LPFEHSTELLQEAARTAADRGRREVDAEHLLCGFTEGDVDRRVLEQFRLSPDDLHDGHC
jgi:ATP-dependent Clp protease ATP-binding subunit ClpC